MLTSNPHSFLSRLNKLFYTINFLTQNTNEGFVVSFLSFIVTFFWRVGTWEDFSIMSLALKIVSLIGYYCFYDQISILIIFLLLYWKWESNNYRMIWKTLFTRHRAQRSCSWGDWTLAVSAPVAWARALLHRNFWDIGPR